MDTYDSKKCNRFVISGYLFISRCKTNYFEKETHSKTQKLLVKEVAC